ncbi:hypothetical protein [Flavobacterium caeni]|nr:hypothetical protein [Flavobacterium caeni]
MTFKQQIHTRYQQLLQDRIDAFRDMIAALTLDAQNDAKGSAGDKHETALSMMHLEQEKLNHKLSEIYAQQAVLAKIDPLAVTHHIALGSLVETNGMLLFVSAALPKISVDGKTVIAVSPQSPLGARLMGQEVGFAFEINGTAYVVAAIT